MKRTVWLQETKQMRFEEAYSGWTERRLTQEDAAQLLGVCARTFRRYIDRYEEDGLDGLLDKRLTQLSHRRAPVDEVLRLVDRYRRIPRRPGGARNGRSARTRDGCRRSWLRLVSQTWMPPMRICATSTCPRSMRSLPIRPGRTARPSCRAWPQWSWMISCVNRYSGP